jgi:prepilin-type N-terminal cleavage/methylation domain-containing protein
MQYHERPFQPVDEGPARRRPCRRPARARRRAFTLLELVVSLAIMAAGLLAVQALLVRQSKQVSRLERWCQPHPTYYVVSQSDKRMRKLGAPASLETQAGQTAWTSPVGPPFDYNVTLNSIARSADGQQVSAQVSLKQKE